MAQSILSRHCLNVNLLQPLATISPHVYDENNSSIDYTATTRNCIIIIVRYNTHDSTTELKLGDQEK